MLYYLQQVGVNKKVPSPVVKEEYNAYTKLKNLLKAHG
jgi:hypothetical protein